MKLNNIQLLRAFAATAVVLFHTGFAFPGLRPFGSFGVDVFFVISGYIMARILDPRTPASGDFFFRRRILRIVPPYWFFTLLLFAIALKVPQLMGSTRATFGDLAMSLFFIPFAKGSGVIQPLLFLGWSLNYEMFFYLALAIGILLHSRLKLTLVGKPIAPVWYGAVLVLAAMLACKPFVTQSIAARFYSRELILEFLLGIVSYFLCKSTSDANARRLRLPMLVVALASAAILVASQAAFPLTWVPVTYLTRAALLGGLSFLLVTSASLLSQGGWDSQVKILVLIGDASYILYLIHPYCEYSLDRLLGSHVHWLKRDTAPGALIGVAVSIAFAILLHLCAEKPTVRFLNKRFGGKRKSTEFAST
jgi:peptidoglycan/LPS O-acetylase OafA/YrhL